MSSYEELYEKVMQESVKGTTGRVALKAIDTGKKIVNKTKETYNKAEDKISSTYNKAKEVKVAGPIIKGVEKVATVPFTATSEVAAKAITKGNEMIIKKKYSGNPEKLESELRKNIEKLNERKTDIMALEIWTIGWPLAINSAGILDNIFKAIIGAGAVAKEDKELIKAVAMTMVWVPVAAAKISKILNKEIEGDEAVNFIKKTTDKILKTLNSWAKSDQPLFVPKRGPEFKSAKFTKKAESVKEAVSMICESILNEEITYEEASFLMESVWDPLIVMEF